MTKSNKKCEQNKANRPSKVTEVAPQGQRERKPRNLPNTSKVENVANDSACSQSADTSQTQPTVSFANLKRETDEILKLTDSKQYSKRQIHSNWTKYEKINNDDEHFDQGADFSSLLQAPISGGGHFQFKSEKDWNMKINSKYNEYFLLDLKSINDALLTIPFYDRFEIDTNLLSSNQILTMNNQALKYQNKYKPAGGVDNKLNNKIVLVDETQSTFQDEINEIPEFNQEINQVEKEIEATQCQIQDVEVSSEVNNFIKKVRELDTEVDDLLSLKEAETETLANNMTKNTVYGKDDLLDEEDVPLKKETKTGHTEVDLEQWLDDILDD